MKVERLSEPAEFLREKKQKEKEPSLPRVTEASRDLRVRMARSLQKLHERARTRRIFSLIHLLEPNGGSPPMSNGAS